MDRLLRPEVDPTELLNELAEPVTVVSPGTGRAHMSWPTAYGASFENHGMRSTWFYRYDESIGHLAEGGGLGCMSGSDVAQALGQLKTNPNKLRDKPASVEYLERLTGQRAFRKLNAFGRWHIVETGKYSMFNNPFGCQLGYTDGADDFEVWYLEKEGSPRSNQTVSAIERTLAEYGYTE
jgi:hypothetical protein